MRQNLIDCIENAKLHWRFLIVLQPLWITAMKEILLLAEVYQEGTSMPRGRLDRKANKVHSVSNGEKRTHR